MATDDNMHPLVAALWIFAGCALAIAGVLLAAYLAGMTLHLIVDFFNQGWEAAE